VCTIVTFEICDRDSGYHLQVIEVDLEAAPITDAAAPLINGNPAKTGYKVRLRTSDQERDENGLPERLHFSIEPTPALLEAGTMVDDPLPGWGGADEAQLTIIAHSRDIEIEPWLAYLDLPRLAPSETIEYTVTPFEAKQSV
jgi:hypothetical protein